MSTTEASGLLDAGLLDVELPAPEALAAVELLPWLALVALLLLAGWLLWWWLYSPRGLAHRRLRQLARIARDGELAPRDVALHLAHALRQGLGLSRLSPRTPAPALPAELACRWQDFVLRLEAARFAPGGCPPENLRALLAEAAFWLRRWPRGAV